MKIAENYFKKLNLTRKKIAEKSREPRAGGGGSNKPLALYFELKAPFQRSVPVFQHPDARASSPLRFFLLFPEGLFHVCCIIFSYLLLRTYFNFYIHTYIVRFVQSRQPHEPSFSQLLFLRRRSLWEEEFCKIQSDGNAKKLYRNECNGVQLKSLVWGFLFSLHSL